MTRVMFWSEGFWPLIGGVEVLAARLLPALCAHGHEFIVVTHRQSPTLAEYEEYQGIPIYRFPFKPLLGSMDLPQVVRIRERILQLKQEFRPDLIHAFFPGHEALVLLSTRAAAPAPLLVTLHGIYPDQELTPTTHLGHMLRAADWVTACSSAVLTPLLDQVPEIRGRASTVANALQAPGIEPTPLSFTPPRLLCIGRLSAEKGFDVALVAFATLLVRFPELRLVLAGDGYARRELEKQATALGIAAHVDFTGWIDPSGVPALLNTVTMVVVPSRRAEGFGLVALQAAQMGRPIVATRAGGLQDVVLDGHTGLLVGTDDPAALAQAVTALLDQPSLAARMGQQAYRHARTKFNWERCVAAYDTLFEQLVQRGAT